MKTSAEVLLRRYGWKDGDPATFKLRSGDLQRGTVRVRRAMNPPFRDYIKIQSGIKSRWEWPDGWVIGTGDHRGQCLECGQDFYSKDAADEFCLPCNRRFKTEADAPSGIRNFRKYTAVNAPCRQPARELTPEELDALEAQRVQDAEDSPY